MNIINFTADWQRWAMWAAVRVGGSFAFDDNKGSP